MCLSERSAPFSINTLSHIPVKLAIASCQCLVWTAYLLALMQTVNHSLSLCNYY